MSPPKSVLESAAAHAARYLDGLGEHPIAPTAKVADLRTRLGGALPEAPQSAERVIDDLVRDVTPGLMNSSNPRFFGWVIGGSLPVAIAADWLTSAWDQNGASNLTSPVEAVVEEICADWLKDILRLPAGASCAFVTGTQSAHTAAFAAARHKLLRDRQWNVEERGLAGAPPIRVLTTRQRHESVLRAARLVGLGTNAIEYVIHDADGRMNPAALEAALMREPDRPSIVLLQAGELNTGLFDPFAEAIPIAHRHAAWVHVDGAFGLWANASPRYRHLLAGADKADSWSTDGHKWLNVPFDSGFVFMADPSAHAAAFAQEASYSVPAADLRNQKDWNPEWSRRARVFPAYAALRTLGRSGVADLVERCCAHAKTLVDGIGALPGAEVLASPIINQGLVRFRDPGGNHDQRTDAVIAAIQASGVAWFGGVTWRGMRAMRISVCNWSTTERDIERTLTTIADVLARPAARPAA